MSTRAAPRGPGHCAGALAAAPGTAIRSGAQGPRPGRRPHLPLEQLQRLSSRLDSLIRDIGLGAYSHRETERQIAEGEAIADGIRGVFRSPTSAGAAAVNPPLWTDGKGRAAVW